VILSASGRGVTIVLVKTLAENQKTIPRSKMRFRIECSLACVLVGGVLPFERRWYQVNSIAAIISPS
jgi:hypothetical protein